jgi:DNA-binding NtrC family response regulator
MTTALIATQGTLAAKARIAWIGRHTIDLEALVRSAGHDSIEFVAWSELAESTAAAGVDLILSDPSSALLAAETSQGRRSPTPIIVVGDAGAVPSGMFVVPAATLEELLPILAAFAVNSSRADRQNRDLEQLVRGIHTGQAMVGNSPIMRRLQGTLSRAADCDATVLIEGPPGSGKSLATRIIHCKSRRVGQPLAVLECSGASVDSLTSAMNDARGSSLVLEDIERLPAAAQALLVRALKERPSANSSLPRLMVTTAAHLPELVARGAFREDLYYRLHAFPIVIPALRERVEDITAIARTILDANAQAVGRPGNGVTPSAQMLIESLPWPGNVTQLEVVVRRAQALAGGGPVERDHVLPTGSSTHESVDPAVVRAEAADRAAEDPGEDAIRPFEEEEQRLLTRALRATKGNVRRAAQLLGIGRATLYRKIQQYKLRLQ